MSSLTAKRGGNERERNSIVVVTVNIHGLIEFSINVYMEEEESHGFLPWRALVRFLSLCV